MKFNTFQIKNFKSFGSKPQTIKEKRLTLIYGKNSIGKSSLMQSMLLFDYFKTLPRYYKKYIFNPEKSYFAGDAIHFEDFQNYVYKKDINNEIVFKRVIVNQDEIYHLLFKDDEDFKYFIKNNLFYYIERQLPKYDNSLENFLDSTLEKNKIEFNEDLIEKKYLNIQNIPILDFIDLLIIKSDVSNKERLLIQYLYFYSTTLGINNKTQICQFVKLHLKIKKIKKIEYSLAISNKNSKNLVMNIKLNDENFLTISDPCQKLFNYKLDCTFDKKSDFIEMFPNIKLNFSINLFDAFFLNYETKVSRITGYRLLAFSFFARLSNIYYQEKKPQFFAPLRSIPKKSELQYTNKKTKGNSKIYSYEQLYKTKYYKKLYGVIKREYGIESFWSYIKSSTKSMVKITKSSFKKSKPILVVAGIIARFLILFVILFVISSLPKFIIMFIVGCCIIFFLFKTYLLNPELVNAINKLLPNKFKISYYDAKTNEKMWRILFDNDETLSKINSWLSNNKDYTPYNISFKKMKQNIFQKLFRKKEKWQLMFKDLRNNTFVTPKEMGTGISQFLPLLLSCIANKKTKIYIEQPELHLHPSMQGDLADEMIRSCKTNNNTIMAETHSEHILLRIMRRMRETAEGTLKDNELKLTPDNVSILYVDANEKRGTYITELELSEDGTLLDPWPGGFFEEGFEERFF